jgi:hypothetical protein
MDDKEANVGHAKGDEQKTDDIGKSKLALFGRSVRIDFAIVVNAAIFPIKLEIFSKPGTVEPVESEAEEDAHDRNNADDDDRRRARVVSHKRRSEHRGEYDRKDDRRDCYYSKERPRTPQRSRPRWHRPFLSCHINSGSYDGSKDNLEHVENAGWIEITTPR